MPSEIRPSSERGRNENDRRSQLGNPEKRPQKTSTVRGFGSGTAGRHHLRFMDTVPSSSQAREQIEYNRHIQKVLAERNGKTLPHCEVQLGYREGLRGGTPEEAEAYRNSLSAYQLKQSRLAKQDLPSDGGDASQKTPPLRTNTPNPL